MSSFASTLHREHIVSGSTPIRVGIHKGEGPALVLIHGISGSGDTWLPVIEPLGEHFTPVTIDLRGHGRSGKPERGYLYDNYIGDLDETLAALRLDRPLIMGHSLGGLVTLWWAARHPARAAALVIEDSPLRSGEDFRAAFDNWIHLNAMPVEELHAHYQQEYPTWKPEVVRRRAEQMTETAAAVFSELREDSLANHGVDRIAEIEHIESPTLLIHGDLDTGGMVHPDDAAAFERRLAPATRVRIPGGSHTLHLDRMRDFLEIAIPFLRQHASSASCLPRDLLEN